LIGFLTTANNRVSCAHWRRGYIVPRGIRAIKDVKVNSVVLPPPRPG
jgi:hypothetical protein